MTLDSQSFHRSAVQSRKVSPRDTVVYTRRGCHLCDEAVALLKSHGLEPRLVDIDANPALAAQYDTCVPVVEIDGQERFRGRVNAVLLRRLLNT